MKIEEIISSLRDQIDDRESLIPPDDPDSIFKHDAEALREAIKTIERFHSENAILKRAKENAEAERDAARALAAGRDMTAVVRCKSCKFSKWNEKKKQRYCTRKWAMYRVRERDYCSYGIKLTAGGNQP